MRIPTLSAALAALLAAACATAAPASPPPLIPAATHIASGAPVVIPEEKRGGPLIIQPGSVVLTALDSQMRVAAVLGSGAPLVPPVPMPKADRTKEVLRSIPNGNVHIVIPPDQVEFTLWSNVVDGTLLMVKNGEHKRLIYIAALIHGPLKSENFELTTICSVPSGVFSTETWFEPVDGIAILKVMEAPESDGAICVDPTKSISNPRYYQLDQ